MAINLQRCMQQSIAYAQAANASVAFPCARDVTDIPGRITHYQTEVLWLREKASLRGHCVGYRQRVRFHKGVAHSVAMQPVAHAHRRVKYGAPNQEELFVASVSKCYMRWFLALAVRQKYCVTSYFDAPVGTIRNDGRGARSVSRILLCPQVRFAQQPWPDALQLATLHWDAYRNAICGNAVKTPVHCLPMPITE